MCRKFMKIFFKLLEEIIQKSRQTSFIPVRYFRGAFFVLKFLFMLFCFAFVLPKYNKMALWFWINYFWVKLESAHPHAQRKL